MIDKSAVLTRPRMQRAGGAYRENCNQKKGQEGKSLEGTSKQSIGSRFFRRLKFGRLYKSTGRERVNFSSTSRFKNTSRFGAGGERGGETKLEGLNGPLPSGNVKDPKGRLCPRGGKSDWGFPDTLAQEERD